MPARKIMAYWNCMRSFRLTFFFALLAVFPGVTPLLRASDALSEPAGGRSATVTQPHITAELIPEATLLVGPKTATDIILHLHMDPDWHTYWINPGEAGLATAIKWTLPPGWSAGPIQWPAPETHAMGPVTTFGYGGDVYLPTTLTRPKARGSVVTDVTIQAHATWLVCKEECIPGKADLDVKLHVAGPNATLDYKSIDNHALFAAARARLPVPNTRWNVRANYEDVGVGHALVISLADKGTPTPLGHLSFFPEQGNVLDAKGTIPAPPQDKLFYLTLDLQQNGEKPAKISGVLVSDQPLIGKSTAIYLGPFSTDAAFSIPSSAVAPAPATTAPAAPQDGTPPTAAPGNASAPATTSAPAAAAAPTLIVVLGLAFVGGLILNLMPCVLPVLSLKVFSLIRHAGENAGSAWKQGVAFTAGVVISFWILSGLLLALQAAGHQLGWGFQMQSPGFVLALTFLFFLLGLNLLGVFELGTSLVGLDVKATSHLGGLTSSFANGALATLAATPCTAPFMGSAVGFAAQQPAAISLLVFTVLALGMAAPYLALTAFPGALRLVPKPGAWMETLRQFMGFLLLGSVIYLVYVFGALIGQEIVPMLLGTLLVAALAAWIFGRGSPPVHPAATRFFSTFAALLLLGLSLAEGVRLTHWVPEKSIWQVYSPAMLQQALKAGHPAFVDFTAAWCLSCKVNEQVALDIDSTKKLFAQKHVALFRGDWTHDDPEISKTLREFNRDGVPLYLLYSPGNPAAPQVLPEVLTPGIVQDALQKVP
jgi:thiol:disulfide interchange protein/DsbC/DsbD-like thiol-disulfide interchange protein